MNKNRAFTIGEIVKCLGITRRMIINYEDHGLLEPDARGKGGTGSGQSLTNEGYQERKERRKNPKHSEGVWK